MVRINVRVDERLKNELEAEARERGVRPSDIVRQALEEHHHPPQTHRTLRLIPDIN